MTNKERVLAALKHQQPDRTPYQISFTQKSMDWMLAHCGGDSFLADIDNCFHDVRPGPFPKERWLDENTWQDRFGVRWDRSIDKDIGNVCNCLLPERNLDDLYLPDITDAFGAFEEQCVACSDKCIQMHMGFSLFERAWSLRGMENLFLDMMEAPEFVDDLLDRICDYNVSLVNKAVKYDIDAVHFGDDWGSQRGMLMSPKTWERFLMPRLARQYAAAKDAGKLVTIHSCGQVQEVFPQLIEIGLDCFNPFQPEVMDVYEMKRVYGDRLSFWGGISTQRLLPYGTPDEVKVEAKLMMSVVGRNGGYILAPAHSIPGDAKPENILALIEAVNQQG